MLIARDHYCFDSIPPLYNKYSSEWLVAGGLTFLMTRERERERFMMRGYPDHYPVCIQPTPHLYLRRTILTSISDLDDVLVNLRLCDSDLRGHLEVLRVLVLVLLHEGRLDGLTLFWRGGCPCWAVWLVGVETVVPAVRGVTPVSPEEYSLLQVNTQVGVSSVGKLYVSHHCKMYLLFWEGRSVRGNISASILASREVSIKQTERQFYMESNSSEKQWEAIKSEKSAVSRTFPCLPLYPT